MSWLSDLMASTGRSNADRSMDEARRAQDTVAIANLATGQTILEIEPGKGWFTGILLELTRDAGTLIAQQPKALEAFFGKEARKRIEKSGQLNAHYSDRSWEALDAADATVDRAVWLQGPHELWFEPQPGLTFGRPEVVFADIARVLKPGGTFTLIDNLAPKGVTQAQAGALHRSVPHLLQEIVQSSGLRLIQEDLEWINETPDPLDIPTYDPKAHLKTRQFLQTFIKSS
ncbi:hypothetical protein [Litoreibacter roseus]|uniref:Methyltransferase domain-containing protein n=1 Tax=Litoreibacter roseus TaxID=2601869 RepID=A0A6N6JHX4_9RHOB|nr:hypothetical protein [Litoreibacter roseus]GFE65714.1 hypothetical protein KIN_27880 [Litoreibacter roseus]